MQFAPLDITSARFQNLENCLVHPDLVVGQ